MKAIRVTPSVIGTDPTGGILTKNLVTFLATLIKDTGISFSSGGLQIEFTDDDDEFIVFPRDSFDPPTFVPLPRVEVSIELADVHPAFLDEIEDGMDRRFSSLCHSMGLLPLFLNGETVHPQVQTLDDGTDLLTFYFAKA